MFTIKVVKIKFLCVHSHIFENLPYNICIINIQQQIDNQCDRLK